MPSTKKTIYSVANSFESYKSLIDEYPVNDGNSIIGECDKFSHPYLTNDTSVTICEHALLFLNDLKKNGDLDYIDQGCRFLYYWIYGKVKDDEKSPDNIIKLYNVFLTKCEESNNKCKVTDYLKLFSTRVIENLIKLFELYEKFNKTKESTSCNECDCVDDSAKLYNNYIDNCYSDNDNDFCDELENFKKIYENHMESAVCPSSVPRILPTVRKHNIAAGVSTTIVIILVGSFFFFFYKFTPFGLRISNLLNRKKGIYNDLDKETKELIYTPGKSNIKSKDNEYSLSYQSIENS